MAHENYRESSTFSQSVNLLLANPGAWMRTSLPKFMNDSREVMAQVPLSPQELEAMSWCQRHHYLASYALQRQEKRWEEAVGIKAAESHFTLVVPIYNEEKSLPSFLSTLMLTDLPASLDVNIVFITNACTDASAAIIRAFLSRVGDVEDCSLPDSCKDKNPGVACVCARRGSVTFMHVDTPTPGKANVLRMGNAIARASGHTIAMSMDANNYVEPDALRALFARAHIAFRAIPQPQDTVLLSGVGQTVMKDSRLKGLLDKGNNMHLHMVEAGEGVVNGWVMAWNTAWMDSIGGPPEVALEDYAMGVLARARQFKIAQVDEAIVWGYGVNDLKGLMTTRARYVRGKLQLLELVDYAPSVYEIVVQEAYYMQNFTGRLHYLLYRSGKSPFNFPKYVAAFLLWEYAVRKGKRDYKRNPTNQSWEKVAATY